MLEEEDVWVDKKNVSMPVLVSKTWKATKRMTIEKKINKWNKKNNITITVSSFLKLISGIVFDLWKEMHLS